MPSRNSDGSLSMKGETSVQPRSILSLDSWRTQLLSQYGPASSIVPVRCETRNLAALPGEAVHSRTDRRIAVPAFISKRGALRKKNSRRSLDSRRVFPADGSLRGKDYFGIQIVGRLGQVHRAIVSIPVGEPQEHELFVFLCRAVVTPRGVNNRGSYLVLGSC